ncbi:pyrroloquinoline quinone precursor peptide PqqA [Caballeronia sp. SEWSISQ10-4 2]|nr:MULTISPECIES: pyrroloquinoline quinone precursor peptide PqqA [unclassified Caballeronia]MCE4544201.1 pyrroloquinoline quinone precursor peptide PqqA [Caballeronia sp. PC1]MCE4570872.1 pyrroloquinoline quinone precursor peptide PqqA [Caballeronia sp. CLC5]MCG7399983.1 pyrroloquinoline quinone precursor peptide PqqA [Caballeronia zhejiangensis]MDN7184523.1 pyrroloquinoline quinone precursor peptide PqqA [Caballeronia sp. SEWSISQ10-4 2]MCE4545446.1 pyrroloquinoline quinone precursor peptide P
MRFGFEITMYIATR